MSSDQGSPEQENTDSLTIKISSKKKVLIFCGGVSGEHEVSLVSTKHVLAAISKKDYEAVPLVIQKSGRVELVETKDFEDLPNDPSQIYGLKGRVVSFLGGSGKSGCGFSVDDQFIEVDVAFPLVHGVGGEDGSLQGFLETCQIPYVGCGIRSSANTMNKAITKKIAKQAGVPIGAFVELSSLDDLNKHNLSFPCFVKPVVGGSSLGISRVEEPGQLQKAVAAAFHWAPRVMVEPAIEGREIEFAVFDDGHRRVISPPGEIRCRSGFYDYESKYVKSDAVELIAPAKMDEKTLRLGMDLASKSFSALECMGLARVDFFLTERGEFLLNEINSIPGFTPISMYPRLIQLAGISYQELIGGLIESAPAKRL